jgi:hypothetical protein
MLIRLTGFAETVQCGQERSRELQKLLTQNGEKGSPTRCSCFSFLLHISRILIWGWTLSSIFRETLDGLLSSHAFFLLLIGSIDPLE